jgi:flagellar hook-associated protein 3 FlgL
MTRVSTSTSAFFNRASLGIADLRARAEGLQSRLGRGERLTRSSDDPVAASRLRTLARTDTLSTIDMTNANRASADLALADTALSSFAEYIQRAQELTTQAASTTLTPAQRSGIGTELGQIHGNLVALANSRDSAGHSLFGGEATGNAYRLDATGNAVYIGSASAGDLPLGEGQVVSRGLTGPEFLNFPANGAPSDLMKVMKDLAAALQGGVADPAAAARDALTALNTGLDAVTTGQTLVGARLAWIDLTTSRRENLGEMRASEQSDIGATDIASTVAQLQQVMLVLEASQASFAKLSQLSLFDALR